jgi:GNAT superfamily N-acetyltransferase
MAVTRGRRTRNLEGVPVADVQIREATDDDLAAIRALMRDYLAWIAMDLAFQEIDAELSGLPGDYAPPRGALLVAAGERGPVGMIALRQLDPSTCEMKRLFVHPSARGQGLARALVTRIIEEARARGYREMRLDTLPMMGDAQSLYLAVGFRDIEPYYDTPIAGTRFMSKRL